MAFITRIDTSTLSNQNISSALLVHTYTNTTRVRKVFVTVDLDQVAGNGDYVVYATVQRAGAGSAFEINPRTTATIASGITSVNFMTIAVVLEATDVLKIYVVGLAGDTTTPDIVTKVFEELPSLAGDQMDLVNAPNATAVTAIQAGLGTSANQTTILGRLIGTIAAGTHNPQTGDAYAVVAHATYGLSAIKTLIDTLTTKVRKYVQLLARKDSAIATDNATELTEINADGGSGAGAYVSTTDSQEAIRDRGDASWGASGVANAVWVDAPVRTLTQSAASVANTVSGSTITVARGTSWSITLTGLPSNSGYSKLWFTAKRSNEDVDSAAIVQVLLSSPAGGTDGLVYFGGAAASDRTKASITVNSSTSITIALDESVSVNAPVIAGGVYDVKMLNNSSASLLSQNGEFNISADVTRAVS